VRQVPLLVRDDSVLVIIDVQERFYRHLATDDDSRLDLVARRCAWLAGAAGALAVPVIVTEEDPLRNGPTRPEIRERLPIGTSVFTKPVFGLADAPEILDAIVRTGRGTVVVAGLETDVCVAQSALGLLDHGFVVAAVADAVFSPAAAHEAGLRRMRDAGVMLVHTKGVYYEWVRTLDAARDFERDYPELTDPPGFSL
jgi:nicotinamidase-related amidase